MNYLRNPDEIYKRSFAIVRSLTGDALRRAPTEAEPIICRIVHACGMPDVAQALKFSDGFASAGAGALGSGAPVLCDTEATAAGVIRSMLPNGNPVLSTIGESGIAEAASRNGTTRSAAGVERWRNRLGDSVVVIGNAPTALFRLLEMLDEGADRPALIIGFPVGFVGAAESKNELARDPRGAEYLTLPGTRGGSAMAAAALNALSAAASAGASGNSGGPLN